jgi:hypothetical protein
MVPHLKKGEGERKKTQINQCYFFLKKKMIAEGGKGAWGNLGRQRKKR